MLIVFLGPNVFCKVAFRVTTSEALAGLQMQRIHALMRVCACVCICVYIRLSWHP